MQVQSVPVTIYNNVWFNLSSSTYLLADIYSITTLKLCMCQCSNNSMCNLGTYFGINGTCVLFSANLSQGQLQYTTNMSANVFIFSNRTVVSSK